MTYFGYITYKDQYPQGFCGKNYDVDKNVPFYVLFAKPYFIIPILVFCFFAAVRYKVGVDCETYKELFYEIGQFGYSRRGDSIEPLFNFIASFVYNFTQSHYLFLFILAFLQITLYYFALRNNKYILIYLSVALILSGEYWSWMNGIRQNIAACAFVALIPLIVQRRWFYTVLVIYVSMQMHKSSLVLAPLCTIAYFFRDRIPNRYLQYGVLLCCFMMMNKFNNILNNISHIAEYAGYAESSIEDYTELEMTTRNFGFRMILLYTVHFITIWFSNKMKLFFESQTFNIWYNLYFIGICLSVLFYNNFTIIRILYYFMIFLPIIMSSLLFYFQVNKNKYNYLRLLCLFLLIINFLYNLYSAMSMPIKESFLYKFDI